MGGSSKQTIGYRYYLGMHMALCHGPVDHISRIRVDDLDAWNGYAKDGSLTIAKEELFGGEKREGGISGSVDIALGYDDQLQNSYLQQHLGTDIPAFRNVVSVILKKVYLGMNPYLKPWSFRAQRIYAQADGSAQWYPEKAPIGYISSSAIYIALDISLSMDIIEPGNGLSRLENAKDALIAALTPLEGLGADSTLDLRIVGYAIGTISIERRNCSGQDITDIIAWIDARTSGDVTNGQTDVAAGFESSSVFFTGAGSKKRISILITDGVPGNNTLDPPEDAQQNTDSAVANLFASSDVTAYGFNIDLIDTTYTAQLDNTPDDGVPVVAGGNSEELTTVLSNAIFSQMDMNPSHIIRECLTNIDWGMGYLVADIGSSFETSADALFSEAMGISLLWDNEVSIENFIIEIARHIDASLYVDKTTGLFELKLIRDDYDEETIPSFDESNVERLENVQRPVFSDLTNSVTVNYWDHKTGKTGTVSVQDTALIQMQGTVVGETIDYPGFTNPELSIKIAQRDLHAMSTPLWTGTMYTGSDAADLNIGDVFKLSWADYGMVDVVMRVTEIAFGDGATNVIRIIFAQDAFAVPSVVVAVPDESGWTDIIENPLPSDARLALEASYYELVRQQGAVEIDAELAASPTTGYLMVSAGRPTSNGAINASIYADIGTGYEDSGIVDFCPYAVVSGAVGISTTVIPISAIFDKDQIVIGTLAQIGVEIVRVDAVTDTEVTVGRAILDTIPAKHVDGSYILFFDGFSASDETEYVDSEVLDVKLITTTPSAILSEDSAPVDQVTFGSRAYRPFRPAGFAAGGYIEPLSTWEPTYPVLLEWDERNRLQETSEAYLAWEDGSVAEEAGTQYSVVIDAYEEDQVTLIANITTTVETGISYSLTAATIGAYNDAPFIKATITSQRDGYDSYQSPVLFFRSVDGVLLVPTDHVAYWAMDDTDISGSIMLDRTSNNHDATMVNAPTTGEVGHWSEAVLFNGIDEHMTVVDHADLKPANIAVVAWVKTTGNTINIYQSYSRNVNFAGIRIYIRSTGIAEVLVANNTGNTIQGTHYDVAESTTLVNDGAYHQIVATYDGTTIKLYVDSILEGTQAYAGGLVYAATNYVRIASRDIAGTPDIYFGGTLDEIKIFIRALVHGEITALYNELQIPPSPTDYNAYWTMDTVHISGATILDQSGNSHDATMVNTPTTGEIGKVNEAILFTAASLEHASVVNHVNLRPSNLTIVGWVKTTSVATGMVFDLLEDPDGTSALSGYELAVWSTGEVRFLIADNVARLVDINYASDYSTTLVNDGAWHFIVGTFDGSNLKIYVDGILETIRSISFSLGYRTTEVVNIGKRFTTQQGSVMHFDGTIDELQMFPRATTVDEIAAMYQNDGGIFSTVIPTDYIGLWSMNDADISAPTINDTSGSTNTHNATMVNTPTTGEAGQLGQSVLFESANSEYATLVDHADLKPDNVTICGWVKASSSATDRVIFSNHKLNPDKLAGFLIWIGSDGFAKFSVRDNTGVVLDVNLKTVISSSVVDDDTYHLIAGTYDGANVKIYVDGVLQAVGAWVNGIDYTGCDEPIIGARNFDGPVDLFFNGHIDHLRFFDYAISAAEFDAIYRNES